jgi:transcriptional regulator with XRE-family HTH domain
MELALGERIRIARTRCKKSQVELARDVGISKTTLSDIETGNTVAPSSAIITDIARVLNVSADFLLGLRDEPDSGGRVSISLPTPQQERQKRIVSPPVMEIAQLLSKSEELTDWIYITLQNLEVKGDIRSRFAIACLDVALEYREAIVLLVSRQMYGAAFALVRSLFESYVRGVWLHRCALDTEIEAFRKDKLGKAFNSLIQDIENLKGEKGGFDSGILSRLKKQGWKAMNGYTHSGFQHIIRRMKQDTIELNYAEDEILEALECANTLGLFCVLEIAFLSTDTQLPINVLEKMRVYAGDSGIDGVI